MKLIDMIGIGLIIVGIMMTAVNFFAARGPDSEVIDSSIQEITPATPQRPTRPPNAPPGNVPQREHPVPIASQ